jgi:arylsulfatase A-like enzyme
LFNNAFSASSWTPPGTASIFTSLYPFEHGVLHGLLVARNKKREFSKLEISRIPEEIDTIAEILKRKGYKTYGVSDNLNIGKKQGYGQGFDQFFSFNYQEAPKINEVVKGWQSELAGNGKYFLYIHYMEPHAPYFRRKPWYRPKENHREERISAYDSEINYVDEHIKELFNTFKWDQNTLVIITSDHGEGLWDHGSMAHGDSLHREQIQVPLMFFLPGGKLNRVITNNVNTMDILPTIQSLLGETPSGRVSGSDLTPLMFSKKDLPNNRFILSHLLFKWPTPKPEDSFMVEFRSVVYKNWHYQIRMPLKRQLFSLINDGQEKINLIDKGSDIATLMQVTFNKAMSEGKEFTHQTTDINLDKKELEKLGQIGYIE